MVFGWRLLSVTLLNTATRKWCRLLSVRNSSANWVAVTAWQVMVTAGEESRQVMFIEEGTAQ
eukprot:3083392-Rhodomonas_salina.1